MKHTPFRCLVIALAATIIPISFPIVALAAETETNNAASARYDLIGSITDTTGTPVNDAAIYVNNAHPRIGPDVYSPSGVVDCEKKGLSAADGSFTIKSLAPDLLFQILIVKDGYNPKYVDNVDPSKQLGIVRLEKAKLRVNGWNDVIGVILDDKGQPVGGARIEPQGLKYAKGGTFGGDYDGLADLAISNEKGQFRLAAPSIVKVYDGSQRQLLGVYGQVEARGFTNQHLILNCGINAKNTVRMTRGATVMGQVLDSKGNPIPGAVVEELESDRNSETFTGSHTIATDSNGRFILPHAAPDKQSVLCIDMSSLLKQGEEAMQQEFTTPDDDKTFDIGVIRTTTSSSISGRIKIEDGIAIPGNTQVTIARDDAWDTQQITVGQDGLFTFHGIPAGEKMGIYSYVQIGGKYYSANKTITMPADQSLAGLELTLTERN